MSTFTDNYGESLAYQKGLGDYEAERQYRERAKELFLADKQMQALALHYGISLDSLWHREGDGWMDDNWEAI